MKITTNNQYRELLYANEIPQVVLDNEFDYQDEKTYGYFKYQSRYYHLDMFLATSDILGINSDSKFKDFHGVYSDSYFSGILIRLSDCGEKVKVASYSS